MIEHHGTFEQNLVWLREVTPRYTERETARTVAETLARYVQLTQAAKAALDRSRQYQDTNFDLWTFHIHEAYILKSDADAILRGMEVQP